LYSSASTPVWDGTSTGFTSYNENFTLAMAQWVRDEILADRYTTNVPYFYSGGVPQVPQSAANCPNCPPGMYGGSGVGGTPFGQGGNPTIGTRQGDPEAGGPENAVLWGMTPQELAELGMNILNIGLDIAAVIAIVFPEPGTSAIGAARLAARFALRAGPRAMRAARAARGAQGLARGLRGARVGATGLKQGGFNALKGGQNLHKGSKGLLSPGGKGVYSAPKVGKVGSGGFNPGTGGARYSRSGSNPLGGAQGKSGAPGGVVGSISPGGSRGTNFIEPQRVVTPKQFQKGQKLFQKVQGGSYPRSSRANQFRQQAQKAGFKPGQTNVPYSQLPKVPKSKNTSPTKSFKNWYNQGRNVRVPNENQATWKQLRADDKAQIGRFVNPKNPVNPDGTPRLTGGALPDPRKGYQVKQFVTGKGGATRSFNPFLGPGQGLRSGPTPYTRQQIERPARAIGRAYSQTPTTVKAAAGASLASVLGAQPAKGQVTSLQKTIKSVENSDGTTNFDKLDQLYNTDPKAFSDYIQHRLYAPKQPTRFSDIAPETPSGETLDSKTSAEVDKLIKQNKTAKPGSSASDNLNKKLLNLLDKIPSSDPRYNKILRQISGSGRRVTNEAYLREDVTTASPTQTAEQPVGELTPEQVKETEQIADQFADNIDLPKDELAELSLEFENESNRIEANSLSENPTLRLDEILDAFEEYNIPLSELTPEVMYRLFTPAEKLAILNTSGVETRTKFLDVLGVSMDSLNNLTDTSYEEILKGLNGTKYGYPISPGGTPSNGWDGKFYLLDDPELEKTRIVSWEQYLEAKQRQDWYGLETPDVANGGYKYKIVSNPYTGKEIYRLVGIDHEYAREKDEITWNARRFYSDGNDSGSGLGLWFDLSMWRGEGPSQLKGYEASLRRAFSKANEYFSNFNGIENTRATVVDLVYTLQRYTNRVNDELNFYKDYPLQLTDKTWNLQKHIWGDQGLKNFETLLSISSASSLYNSSVEYYGGKEAYNRAKIEAESVWERWQIFRDYVVSLENVEWEQYLDDEAYGEGTFTKTHPLSGIDSEPPRDGYNYYPKFDDIEDIPKKLVDDDFSPTEEDLGAAGFAAYKAGGGDAKVKQGLTVAEVIAQGKINLTLLLPGATLQRPIQNPEKNSPNLFKGVVELIGTLIPQTGSLLAGPRGMGLSELYRVQTQIAKSILQNEPIRSTAASPYEIRSVMELIEKDAINVDKMQAAGSTNSLLTTLGQVTFVDKPRNYSDDHIYEDDNGNVRTHTPQSRQKYPSTVGSIIGRGGEGVAIRPIAERGEAQLEIVVPRDGSEPYLRYLDHAYLNINYNPGEVSQGWQEWISKRIVDLRDFAQGGRGHTGAFSNYPDFIKGDERLEFTVPYRQMSDPLKRIIDRYRSNYSKPGELTQTDAAIAAYERKKREEAKKKKDKEWWKFWEEEGLQRDQFRLSDFKRSQSETPSTKVLSESRKRILREIRKPYELPEPLKKKYKMNFKGKFRPQNTPDVTASRRTEESVKAQNAAGQTWRSEDKYWKGYETVERMNILYDNIGHGSQYWDRVVNENQNRKGWRDREVQEQLNMIAHEKAMIRENPQYESPFQKQLEEQETMQYDNDPLFKKVSNKLKKEIDYDNKPARLGYPDKLPPEMLNGWHPEYGNKDAYYNKLDPHSAEAMPSTGNEKIDAAVEKAKKQPKKGAPAKANPPKGS